ncbi:MAG: hypothetical protein WC394_04500 [Candidatus Omnitrophota bacterium]|jgi:hypothetical protein
MLGRVMGLYAIVPTTLVLTISFFVLFVLREVKSNVLKVFGYVIAALLWLSALLIFSAGIYTLATGRCPMQKMMMQKQEMMCRKMMDKSMADKPMMDKSMMDKSKMGK